MNGFRYVLVHEDAFVDADETLAGIQRKADSNAIHNWYLSIIVYRWSERVGQLVFNPHIGWWNVGQWADMELMQ